MHALGGMASPDQYGGHALSHRSNEQQRPMWYPHVCVNIHIWKPTHVCTNHQFTSCCMFFSYDFLSSLLLREHAHPALLFCFFLSVLFVCVCVCVCVRPSIVSSSSAWCTACVSTAGRDAHTPARHSHCLVFPLLICHSVGKVNKNRTHPLSLCLSVSSHCLTLLSCWLFG